MITTQQRLRLALVCGLSALAFAAGLPAQAQAPAGLARYAGQYKYAGTKDQGVAIVDKGVEQALASMNMLTRAMVKRNMSQRFIETIQIGVTGTKVQIRLGDLPPATTVLGKSEPVKTPDGKPGGTVSHTLDGSELIQTLANEESTITNTFELSGDGKTLERSVTIRDSRLKKPIRYRLSYVRK